MLKTKKKFKATHTRFMSTTKWMKLFTALNELKKEYPELENITVLYTMIDNAFKDCSRNHPNGKVILPYTLLSKSDFIIVDNKFFFNDIILGSGELDEIWEMALPIIKRDIKIFSSGAEQISDHLFLPNCESIINELNKIAKFPYEVMIDWSASYQQETIINFVKCRTLWKFIIFYGYPRDTHSPF